MPRSAQLDGDDVRAAFQLAGECRELGDDAVAWRHRLGDGLYRLIGADIVLCVETAGCTAGRPVDLGVADWGWQNGFDRAGWLRAVEEFHRNPRYPVGLGRYFGRLAGQDGVVHTRRELVPDAEWEPSFDCQVIHRSVGIDDIAWCFRAVPDRADEFAGVMAARAPGRPDFDPREKAVLGEVQRVVAPLVGGPLARFVEPNPADLPPRARLVLKCFLEGDSDKQVGRRLGLTRHTVNQYAKQIYRHFGVTNRPELLARWLRRGWGNRCAWAAE